MKQPELYTDRDGDDNVWSAGTFECDSTQFESSDDSQRPVLATLQLHCENTQRGFTVTAQSFCICGLFSAFSSERFDALEQTQRPSGRWGASRPAPESAAAADSHLTRRLKAPLSHQRVGRRTGSIRWDVRTAGDADAEEAIGAISAEVSHRKLAASR